MTSNEVINKFSDQCKDVSISVSSGAVLSTTE